MTMLTNGPLFRGLLLLHATPWAAESTVPVNLVGLAVTMIDSVPEGPYRTLVVQGHELSIRTLAWIGPEVKGPRKRLARNNLARTSRHQAAAAKPFAIPWVGLTATFPPDHGRADPISTVVERINGCMERSTNGKPLTMGARTPSRVRGGQRLFDPRQACWPARRLALETRARRPKPAAAAPRGATARSEGRCTMNEAQLEAALNP